MVGVDPAEGGSGVLSETLGVFDVSSPGDTFDLPADGSLRAIAADFDSAFPNGAYAFTAAFLRLAFRFDSLTPIAGTLVNSDDPGLSGSLESEQIACLGGPPIRACQVFLVSATLFDPVPRALAVRQLVVGPDVAEGSVAFTFTVVPEAGRSTAVAAGLGLLAVAMRARAHAAGRAGREIHSPRNAWA